jgi:hypothetical protein
VLVLVIWIMPRGLIGGFADVRKLFTRRKPSTSIGQVRHG